MKMKSGIMERKQSVFNGIIPLYIERRLGFQQLKNFKGHWQVYYGMKRSVKERAVNAVSRFNITSKIVLGLW